MPRSVRDENEPEVTGRSGDGSAHQTFSQCEPERKSVGVLAHVHHAGRPEGCMNGSRKEQRLQQAWKGKIQVAWFVCGAR